MELIAWHFDSEIFMCVCVCVCETVFGVFVLCRSNYILCLMFDFSQMEQRQGVGLPSSRT